LGILSEKKNKLDFRIKIRIIYVPPLKKMIADDDVEPQSLNFETSQWMTLPSPKVKSPVEKAIRKVFCCTYKRSKNKPCSNKGTRFWRVISPSSTTGHRPVWRRTCFSTTAPLGSSFETKNNVGDERAYWK
jgi:hypothetical protein